MASSETTTQKKKKRNNYPIYQFIIPYVVKLLGRYRPRLAPRVLLLTPNLIVKYGSPNIYSEARAIEFIAQSTSVPVPQIITDFVYDGIPYILMERCPGVPLLNIIPDMPLETRQRVFAKLREYMDEIRALTPPQPGKVGSADYGPLDDYRLHDSAIGPFENVVEFHKAIRRGFNYPTGHEECDQMILAQEKRPYTINFTHGDLSLRHIYYLDGKITGILDWESAGWYPDYWEFASAWESFWESPGLRDQISKFLDPFPEEQKTESVDRDYSGVLTHNTYLYDFCGQWACCIFSAYPHRTSHCSQWSQLRRKFWP